MMGPEYFTVGAYATEGGELLCPKCGDEAGRPTSEQLTLNQLWEDFGNDPYYREHGLSCECGEELIEPEDEDDGEDEGENEEDDKQ